MSLTTRNMMRIGRARATELREQRIAVFEIESEGLAALTEKLGDFMADLKHLDPIGWEAWYEGAVPSEATYAQILPIVRVQVEFLESLAAGKEDRLKSIFSVMKGDQL